MIKATRKFIIADGELARVSYYTGPWVDGVDPTTIKIYLRSKTMSRFPKSFSRMFEVKNNSDVMSDYFEDDTITVTASHPLYEIIRAAATK